MFTAIRTFILLLLGLGTGTWHTTPATPKVATGEKSAPLYWVARPAAPPATDAGNGQQVVLAAAPARAMAGLPPLKIRPEQVGTRFTTAAPPMHGNAIRVIHISTCLPLPRES